MGIKMGRFTGAWGACFNDDVMQRQPGAWEEWRGGGVFSHGGHLKLTWLHLGQSLLSKGPKCIYTPADPRLLSPSICVPPWVLHYNA